MRPGGLLEPLTSSFLLVVALLGLDEASEGPQPPFRGVVDPISGLGPLSPPLSWPLGGRPPSRALPQPLRGSNPSRYPF